MIAILRTDDAYQLIVGSKFYKLSPYSTILHTVIISGVDEALSWTDKITLTDYTVFPLHDYDYDGMTLGETTDSWESAENYVRVRRDDYANEAWRWLRDNEPKEYEFYKFLGIEGSQEDIANVILNIYMSRHIAD